MPDTYGGMALSILKKACSNGQIVHIMSYTYANGHNIKDVEHDTRGVIKSIFQNQWAV